MIESNRAWYERPAAVREYAAKDHLEAPEDRLVELVRSLPRPARMLDLGVGAGRTTPHFAPLVDEYVGVDYSGPLVEVCRQRFAGQPGIRFELADARDMPMLADASFDVVLFSVNGIDCLDHQSRLQALAEIARVSRPGAWFMFSSHNLDAIRRALSMRARIVELSRTRSALRLVPALARWLPEQLLKRVANPSATRLQAQDWVWISKLWPPRAPQMTYHVKAVEVRRQLEAAGFMLEQVILASGATAPATDGGGLTSELWLNFIGRRTGGGS